jgi:transposase
VYGRGRPRKGEARQVKEVRYHVQVELHEDKEAVDKLREEAGCFVLLSNVPADKRSGQEILRIYKEQDGIEKNFGFLKDPLVVNDVFLKKPRRIEAMGLVLVLALLLWRLLERALRKKTKEENIRLPGWNNTRPERPTAFMMTSKFSSVIVGAKGGERFLINPLNETQHAYLRALDVPPEVFTQLDLKRASAGFNYS